MQNVLKQLAYYDVLDRPFLMSDLGTSLRSDLVSERDGYYYLFDREYLVPLRKERQRISRRKWQIARRVAWWLRFVPFARVVFVSGSLSMENADELSDLDVIVVAKHGHIWTVRLLVMGLLIVLGKARRHEDRVAPDKICPNHFVTDQSLHIPFHSMYTAHLYANLVPLIAVDRDDLKKFREANTWVRDYASVWNMPENKIVPQGLSFALQWLCEIFIGTKLEAWSARYQRHRIESKANVIRPGGHLVYNDNMLAFHLGSSEAEILRKYEDNKSKLIT
ncbi:MAG: hypothetical protein AAB420_03140 [Patescibacteria group bacterium]